MGKPSKEEIFVREFMLSSGFLGGLFAKIGIDPEQKVLEELLKIAIPAIQIHNPTAAFLLLILAALLPMVSFIINVMRTYGLGRILGLLAVVVAWFSGFWILDFPYIMFWLLLIAFILGLLATHSLS